MNLIQKRHAHAHRGVIGIESAIVLIAFVIVAAALAFVVLNMGFATTQKAKTAIISSLDEAGSSLEISGKVVGFARTATGVLNATAVPIKLTAGGASVDLNDNRTSIKYISNAVQYDDILDDCTLPSGPTTTYSSTYDAFFAATAGTCQLDQIPIEPAAGNPSLTTAVIYWAVANNSNDILDPGEHAVLAIAFAPADRPTSLDTIRTEIVLSTGATLTVERQVPNLSTTVVDLG